MLFLIVLQSNLIKMGFLDITIWFQFVCMFLSFIISLRTIKNKNIPGYMRGYYWYSLIAATLSVWLIINMYILPIKPNYYSFINNTSLLFHFIFLSLFIYRASADKETFYFYTILFLIFLLVISFSLLTHNLEKHSPTSFALTNLGLVIFCIFYYYQLFRKTPTLNLLHEASFWITNGVFFSMCATIPVSALKPYLFNTLPHEAYFLLSSINYFSYGVMHLFFIKAYLCSIHPHKA